MKKYKENTTFTVCSRKELENKGWVCYAHAEHYTHKDFSGCILSFEMLDTFGGQTLTVTAEDRARDDWYYVSDSTHYVWPVATFLETDTDSGSSDHVCEEEWEEKWNIT